MKNLLAIALASALVAIASCHSKDITCSPGAVNIQVVGFTKADLDSAIAIRYKADNTFGTVIDTAAKLAWIWNENIDTASLAPIFGNTTSLQAREYFSPGYDYRIIFKTVARTVEVTDITLAGNTHQHITESPFDKKFYVCYNNVVSFKINGQAYTNQTTTYPQNTANFTIAK